MQKLLFYLSFLWSFSNLETFTWVLTCSDLTSVPPADNALGGTPPSSTDPCRSKTLVSRWSKETQLKANTLNKSRKSFAIGWPCWRGSVCKCPSAGEFGTPGLRCGPGASSSGWWWRLSPLYNGFLLVSICMTEKVNPCQKGFYPWASPWKEGILKYFWLYQSAESFQDRAAENLNDSTTVGTVAEIMIKLVLLTLLQWQRKYYL